MVEVRGCLRPSLETPRPAKGARVTHWRIAHGVAWVGDADRVALVDTRRGAQAVPMHVQAPFATLWTALAAPVITTCSDLSKSWGLGLKYTTRWAMRLVSTSVKAK